MNEIQLGFVLACLAVTIATPMNALRILVFMPTFLTGFALGSLAIDALSIEASSLVFSLAIHVFCLAFVMVNVFYLLRIFAGQCGTPIGTLIAFWGAAEIGHVLAQGKAMVLTVVLSPKFLVPAILIFLLALYLDASSSTSRKTS